MPTGTQWLLALHVLAALWLAAGVFAGAVVRAQARRTPELAGKVTAIRIGWRLMTVCGIPGSVIAGLSGLALLEPLAYGFKPGWVHASLGLWLVLLALALFYLAPRLKKTLAAAEASLAAGAPTDDLKRLTSAAAPRILADVVALGVVVLVLLMVLKPF
jgi:uncharacterized membrane protein